MAILAAAMFSSCTQEADNNEYVPKENGIAFYLQSTSTRSAEIAPQVNTIELEGIDNFVLEESVASLDEDWFYAPETRGTPAYTENVAGLYQSFMGIAYKYGTTTIALDDAEFTANNGKWEHIYDILDPLANGDLRFFMRMPADVIDAQCENMDYKANGNIEFDYTSPTTATKQKDLLFTSRPLSKSDYNPREGASLLFHHALTGVKFRVQNGDELDDLGVTITKVVFDGFQTSGHCTIVPNSEDNYKDNTTNYSSATAVTWDDSELEGKTSIEISETFDGMIDYTSSTTSLPAAFYAKDATYNINDASASKTFWLIPQAMSEGKTITIYFTMSGKSEEQYFVINVDQIKSGVQWNAGEIRTYTFKVNEVNVKIEDKVTIPSTATADNGYKDSYKSQVTITNTGNTPAFIRAAIVGQWVDFQGDPVFGFTDKVNNLYLVESWWQDQFGNGPESDHDHGEFIGLAGYKNSGDSGNTTGAITYNSWVLCTDGYYYYKKAVVPNGTTSALFDTYTIKKIPNSEIAGQNIDNATMHFTLEIATQAIAATELDGTVKQTGEGEDTEDDWASAWAKALGSAPQPGHPNYNN